jgi:hypothetical protein
MLGCFQSLMKDFKVFDLWQLHENVSAFHNSYADLNHLLSLHILIVVANWRDSSLIYLSIYLSTHWLINSSRYFCSYQRLSLGLLRTRWFRYHRFVLNNKNYNHISISRLGSVFIVLSISML